MTTELTDTLSQLESALERDDYASARELATDLFERYDEREPTERARIERAKAVSRQNRPNPPESVESYLDTVQQSNVNRAGATYGLGLQLANPDVDADVTPSEFVSTLSEHERERAKAADAVESELDAVSLPATPVLTATNVPSGPAPKGGTVTATTVAGNVGDEPVDDATVTVSADSGVTPESSSVSLGTLDARTTEQVEVALDLRAAGEHAVSFELDAPDASNLVRSGRIEVLGKRELVETATTQLQRLRDRVQDLDLSGGRRRSLDATLQAALEKLSDAAAAIDRGRAKKANTQLNAATKQVGAFSNAVEAAGPGSNGGDGGGNGNRGSSNAGLSNRSATGLLASAEDVIDRITTAKEAEI